LHSLPTSLFSSSDLLSVLARARTMQCCIKGSALRPT
jgi:hypothetical protein